MTSPAGAPPGPAGAAPSVADLRLAAPAGAAWLVALFVTSVPAALGLSAAGVLALATLALAVAARRRAGGAGVRVVVVLGVLGCATASALAAGLRVASVSEGAVAGLAADRAVGRATLVVTGDPHPRRSSATHPWGAASDGVVLRARLEGLVARGVDQRVRVPVVVLAPRDGWANLLPSQRVSATVRLAPAGPGAEVAALVTARGPPSAVGPPTAVQRVAARLRAGLRDSVRGLPADERGLVPGLVVGDTTALSADLEEDFRTAGLTHLVAVSGANVAVVLAAVLLAGRWAGVRGYALPAVGAAGLVGFLVLARPEPSVLRATVMGLVVVVGLVRGGRHGGIPALSAAVLVLVLVDPFLARSAGFALSVLATAGLLVIAPGWRDGLRRFLPARLADALAVPAAAQATVAPVLVLLSPQVSVVAVPANLLVAPAVPAATVLGVLAAVLAPVLGPAARACGYLAGVPAGWIVLVGRRAAQVPWAGFGWPAGVLGALALAGLLLAVAGAWPRLRRHPRGTAYALVLALVLGSPLGPRRPWPPPGWLAVMCDVGQGDAIVLAAGSHAGVVVDAGPDPRAVDRCLRDLGVRQVPLVLLTHFHADHVEGLPGVLVGRSVGEVQVSPLADPAEEAARVTRWTARARVPTTVAAVGERRAVAGLRWQVLWPSRLIGGDGSPPNNASVVLLVEVGGVSLLLAGDVEPAAQRALRVALGPDPRVDVLKVAHHGSRHQDPDLLRVLAPRAALVSVGADNDYGHPDLATLQGLGDRGAVVLRTDQHGDLAVVGSAQALRVVPRR